MRISSILLAAFLAAAAPIVPLATQAHAQDDNSRARNHLRSGETMSLREIERRILPKMRGMQYLGPEYDARAQIYRLKFLKDGRVYFVDVDARTGEIVETR
ncbi:PepSY domain-containing protein [Novosphingopyxis iocasae]|uniref:PepSY domain-containing protein n=1 Tax=Novosphingopyxis iocasae TaxID=2762729 RepID=UPI001650FDA7|nr:PepSY domain-containing protein [Novosphingopyxis iocasae]